MIQLLTIARQARVVGGKSKADEDTAEEPHGIINVYWLRLSGLRQDQGVTTQNFSDQLGESARKETARG